jgi:uncharacterized protein YbjT (DUF2867 family)
MTLAGDHVLVLGGSGFVGRHVVARLTDAGMRVVVLTRRREQAKHLILLPTVEVVEGDPGDPAALARVLRGARAVVNLVGILNETTGRTFARVHVDFVRDLLAACQKHGVRRFVHMSALNADPAGPSKYLRSKGEADALVQASGLAWTILRPSVIFGREDAFLNLFARLTRVLPVVALAGAQTRFQPVYVGDVAHCVALALADDLTIGHVYELGGPKVYTLRELVRYVGLVTGAVRPIVPLSAGLSRLQATVLEHLPGTLMSRDNLDSMQKDNVCTGPFPAVFGIAPAALEAVAPEYLAPEARRSPYDPLRAARGR